MITSLFLEYEGLHKWPKTDLNIITPPSFFSFLVTLKIYMKRKEIESNFILVMLLNHEESFVQTLKYFSWLHLYSYFINSCFNRFMYSDDKLYRPDTPEDEIKFSPLLYVNLFWIFSLFNLCLIIYQNLINMMIELRQVTKKRYKKDS